MVMCGVISRAAILIPDVWGFISDKDNACYDGKVATEHSMTLLFVYTMYGFVFVCCIVIN